MRAYVRAACDAGREGLGAATPITRDQWCAQDPGNADRLASAPDFSLMLSSGGESVVLTWVREGASKRFAVPGDRRESLQRSPRCCRAVRRPEGAKAPGSPASGTDRNVRYAAVRPNRADRTGRNARPVRHLSGFRYGRYAFFTTSPRGCPFARDPPHPGGGPAGLLFYATHPRPPPASSHRTTTHHHHARRGAHHAHRWGAMARGSAQQAPPARTHPHWGGGEDTLPPGEPAGRPCRSVLYR